jgi:hemoglobin
MSDVAVEISMFERIGGASPSTVWSRASIGGYVLPDAKGIRAMHAANLEPTKNVLKRYLCEWMGGPKLYSAEKGHPRLRQRHMGFKISELERDAWLLCMKGALEESVAEDEARQEIYGLLAKLADWMRNQAGNPHDTGAQRP